MTSVELLRECAGAAEHPTFDLKGNRALLIEIRARQASMRIDCHLAELAERLLIKAVERGQDHFNYRKQHLDHDALASLIKATEASAVDFVYHGTLKSRLSSIAKQGLVPSGRKRSWGITEIDQHAASAVFVTTEWRLALNWIRSDVVDEDGQAVRGAVLRIPCIRSLTEVDLRPTFGCNLMISTCTSVSVDKASVMLTPFSVTTPWLELPVALQMLKEERQRARMARQ